MAAMIQGPASAAKLHSRFIPPLPPSPPPPKKNWALLVHTHTVVAEVGVYVLSYVSEALSPPKTFFLT